MSNQSRYTYIFVAECRGQWGEDFEFKWPVDGSKKWMTEEDIDRETERYMRERAGPSGEMIRHVHILKRIDHWTGRVATGPE